MPEVVVKVVVSMDDRGRVLIPKVVREELNFRPGSKLWLTAYSGVVVLALKAAGGV